jgi:chromate transporter
VLAIVLQAVVRIGRRALKNPVMVGLAAASFIAIFAFAVPFPAIILAAGVIGTLGGVSGARAFAGGGHGAVGGRQVADAETILGNEVPQHAQARKGRSLRVAALLLLLWLGPTFALLILLGPDHVFSDIAVFFSQMAVVTFGGAYAVLAYVAQAAVESYGWLAPGEMLDGLGMAETTPGPLIMVTQFVGFMGAFRDPGGLSPLVAGVLGGLLTTWVTFAPCFLWIFLGAPYIERLRGNRALSAALTAITAAVVGVILNLAVWFAVHVVFREVASFERFGLQLAVPGLTSIDWAAAALAAAALIAVFRFRVSTGTLLAAAALAGLALHVAGIVVP